MEKIRNFSIIAHIDHGKSTLADRMLEITKTVEKRKMKEQVLDQMELERERGITIKMQPVRMEFEGHILNLIDTPGHIDFYYEVSRALKAVDGAILLVDATQGVQAQTLSTLEMAREFGLKIIPVLNKIDSPLARIKEARNEVVEILKCSPEEVLEVSGKTGEGVEKLLEEVIKKIPAPKKELESDKDFRGLIFDFQYSSHKGIIVFVRVFDGKVSKNDQLIFSAAKEKFISLETGIFSPEAVPKDSLQAGEIGYIVTGIKKPGIASVGDTVRFANSNAETLGGYMKPSPVVWASVYPESQDDFMDLSRALERLQLSDSSFSYEEESSGLLGRGFRIGFLGTLHMEIFVERLHREFDVDVIVTTPSIMYDIKSKNGKIRRIYSPSLFPDFGEIESITEPWVNIEIITPNDYMSPIIQLLFEHEAEIGNSDVFGDGRIKMHAELPLRELMRGFFDKLKSVSAGYASISYKIGGMREADVARLDLLVAEEVVPAFTKMVSKKRIEEEAKASVEKLYKVLPRQMFVAKIQAMALGRIISSKTLSALKKDVTGHLYGGDITRKMKLREKQKKGKKKMKKRGKVNIPQDVFLKMMR
ncbi:MAG: translation elongation factor 4 [Candidatus Pacebacteria bacterium]|jgi:GTP-binding protein LepA|nr:elongation factor 4 [Parcubacteria group bacterium]MDP6249735.1 translation elongation factor 4 [Candidatus Paceibacterota bacterium]MDP7159543.1 translation elongation factor 4 [Candidatus Paceibacterota bacterium]MDP7366262.1 translation elongation factor 4 [Candidatus Paceibacterota bacterium]MDP7466151.1 translation elongation factor 4 [Candidatus Paceibacterota bacterium]|tara:strand:+ start:8567 stop:10339 length:1773 start_codon:yes stop_codon:yes gene_type:complete